MAELNIAKTSVLDREIEDYSVDPISLNNANANNKDTYWDFPDATQNIGYYKTIPELKKAIDALADYTTGKGYTADAYTNVILKHISGWGKDSFQQILWNLQVMKKLQGDAFAEIIRGKDGEILNLKVLSPERMRIIVGKNGIIKGYEQIQGNDTIKFKPEEILHLCNDRLGDEIHGTSVIDACKWVIDARNEAMTDYRKLIHRNVIPVRIIEIDTDDTTKRNAFMAEYKDAIQKGEVLVIPKGVVDFKEDQVQVQDPIAWIQYLESFFYIAVGISRSILGGTDGVTEAASKVSTFNFDQVWQSEQAELESDIINQLGIEIKFNRPASLMDNMQSDEMKNTGQIGFQPAESQVNMTTGGKG